MKVKDLIEQLQTMDPELYVFTKGYEGGFEDAGPKGGAREIVLDVNKEWYYGQHEDADNVSDKSNYIIVKGIIL